jgi:hypothetical protein
MKWVAVALASVLVIGGALALLVTVGPFSGFASSIQADLDGASAKGQQFSGEVEMLGMDQFPQIFANATVNADGSVSIYCTQVTSALRTAVANADTDGAKYSFVIVPHSYAAMEQTTLAIANDQTLAADGVALNNWGPDPARDQVKVKLTEPSVSQMKELATALGVPAFSITLTTYPHAVQTLLRRKFGDIVIVSSTYQPPVEPVSGAQEKDPLVTHQQPSHEHVSSAHGKGGGRCPS